MSETLEPKMVKYQNDECYGKKFKQIAQCNNCWISTSCGAVYKSDLKKKASANKPKKIREKKYKKTANHRDW